MGTKISLDKLPIIIERTPNSKIYTSLTSQDKPSSLLYPILTDALIQRKPLKDEGNKGEITETGYIIGAVPVGYILVKMKEKKNIKLVDEHGFDKIMFNNLSPRTALDKQKADELLRENEESASSKAKQLLYLTNFSYQIDGSDNNPKVDTKVSHQDFRLIPFKDIIQLS